MSIAKRLEGRIYYGWVIVGTLALTETVSWGILFYMFSVFLVPMRDELGWSDATLTGAYSLGLLVSGFAAPFVGRWIDRRGPRWLMTGGSLLGVALVLAWSRVGSELGWYLIWVGMGLAMAATLYDPAFTAVAAWFERDRAKAFLLVTIAAGFASTIFLPLAAWLERVQGWQSALVTLAGILFVLAVLPHAIFLRRRPEDLGLSLDGRMRDSSPSVTSAAAAPGAELREVLRDSAFWWLALGFALGTLSTVAVALYLIAFLTDRGDSAEFAAFATGLIGAAQVGARILATLVGNRVSHVTLAAIVFGVQALAVAILLEWEGTAGVLVAVLILGMGRGVMTLSRPAVLIDFYGRRNFGAINGSFAFTQNIARALAPVTAGLAFGVFGGYRPVFWGLGATALVAAALILGAGRQAERSRGAYLR
ncbi:MAG: MFS transporter [Thermomicrobiales bacterium]|nr:MFS transporter [Thermomicrobiales bacterium]